jgi:hypothetical protein
MVRLLVLAFLLFLGCTDFARENPLDPKSDLYGSEVSGSSTALCNGKAYNTETHFCMMDLLVITEKCGGKDYYWDGRICENGVVYRVCNGEKYNEDTHSCCNGETYNWETHFCTQRDECDSKTRNEEYAGICAVTELCGGNKYKADTQVCVDGVIKETCGEKLYDVSNQRCGKGNVVETLCQTTPPYTFYDASTHFCYGNSIIELCGGEKYNPAINVCENNIIKERLE